MTTRGQLINQHHTMPTHAFQWSLETRVNHQAERRAAVPDQCMMVRNAREAQRVAATHALGRLGSDKADVDLLIVGAGPAGLAASLAAMGAEAKLPLHLRGALAAPFTTFRARRL